MTFSPLVFFHIWPALTGVLVPVVAVIVLTIYWLIRVRFATSFRKASRTSGTGGAATFSALNELKSEGG